MNATRQQQLKIDTFDGVVFIVPIWSTAAAAANRASCLTGLDLGQTKLSARFDESGRQPIGTLSARQVMQVLAGSLRQCDDFGQATVSRRRIFSGSRQNDRRKSKESMCCNQAKESFAVSRIDRGREAVFNCGIEALAGVRNVRDNEAGQARK